MDNRNSGTDNRNSGTNDWITGADHRRKRELSKGDAARAYAWAKWEWAKWEWAKWEWATWERTKWESGMGGRRAARRRTSGSATDASNAVGQNEKLRRRGAINSNAARATDTGTAKGEGGCHTRRVTFRRSTGSPCGPPNRRTCPHLKRLWLTESRSGADAPAQRHESSEHRCT